MWSSVKYKVVGSRVYGFRYFLCWIGLGDHPKTFLLKALCCQSAPSSLLKVRGGGWLVVACEILLSALGLGVVSILYSLFYSQVPGPRSQVPGPSPKSQSQSLDNRNSITPKSLLMSDRHVHSNRCYCTIASENIQNLKNIKPLK